MLFITKPKQCPADIQMDIDNIINSNKEMWDGIPDTPNSEQGEIIRRTFFDNLNKQRIREELVREQHGLCAYCMDRIEPTDDHMVLEHWYPLRLSKSKAMDYENILGSCRGGENVEKTDEKRVFCCDKKKGRAELKIADPRKEGIVDRIKYRKNGIIYIDESNMSKTNRNKLLQDINQTLHLNGKYDLKTGVLDKDTATQLVKKRKDTYEIEEQVLLEGIESGEINDGWILNEMSDLINKRIWDPFLGVKLFVLRSFLSKV